MGNSIARNARATALLFLAAAGIPAVAAQPAEGPASVASRARIGAWGFDLAARDLSVRPGDDFVRYATGKWLDRTTIPADKSSVSSFYDVFDSTQDQEQALISKAPETSKYGALYKSMLDEGRVEAVGLAPLLRDVAAVKSIQSKAALAHYMGTTGNRFGNALFGWGPGPDSADASMNVLYLFQNGLGMPDRDYYLKDEFKLQRDAYRAYMIRTFRTLGFPDPTDAANKVLGFETAVARKSWASADRRDIDKTNNPMSSAALSRYAPGFPWASFFAGAKIPPQKRMIVNENTAIRDLARIYAQTPLETLKDWEIFQVSDTASPYLTKAMVDSRFDYVKTVSGVTQLRPRWKRAIGLVDNSVGELVGQDYVNRYFPPSSKAKMTELVANLKAAMADRIRKNDWMNESTKEAAIEKLQRMDVMVGYPDKFRDFSKLTIKADDLYGNVARSNDLNGTYGMEDLGKPVNHKKWALSPQTVNAYNGGGENKIVFPAGILQPPFFDPAADDAVNYGAIGAIIGHEISHGFDDQGRKIDATGAVHDWWTAEDSKRFDAEAKIFGEQYAKFEVAPGAHINPELTMGENIADLAGILVALDGYHRSLNGKPAPVIDGLTGDQRFFLSYAQAHREKAREDALRNQVATNPHSPGIYRILGPLPNVDAWYEAFGVTAQDKMYIPPEKRARIW